MCPCVLLHDPLKGSSAPASSLAPAPLTSPEGEPGRCHCCPAQGIALWRSRSCRTLEVPWPPAGSSPQQNQATSYRDMGSKPLSSVLDGPCLGPKAVQLLPHISLLSTASLPTSVRLHPWVLLGSRHYLVLPFPHLPLDAHTQDSSRSHCSPPLSLLFFSFRLHLPVLLTTSPGRGSISPSDSGPYWIC